MIENLNGRKKMCVLSCRRIARNESDLNFFVSSAASSLNNPLARPITKVDAMAIKKNHSALRSPSCLRLSLSGSLNALIPFAKYSKLCQSRCTDENIGWRTWTCRRQYQIPGTPFRLLGTGISLGVFLKKMDQDIPIAAIVAIRYFTQLDLLIRPIRLKR